MFRNGGLQTIVKGLWESGEVTTQFIHLERGATHGEYGEIGLRRRVK